MSDTNTAEKKQGPTALSVLSQQLANRRQELYDTSNALQRTTDSLIAAKYELGFERKRANCAEESVRRAWRTGCLTGILTCVSGGVIGSLAPLAIRFFHQ